MRAVVQDRYGPPGLLQVTHEQGGKRDGLLGRLAGELGADRAELGPDGHCGPLGHALLTVLPYLLRPHAGAGLEAVELVLGGRDVRAALRVRRYGYTPRQMNEIERLVALHRERLLQGWH